MSEGNQIVLAGEKGKKHLLGANATKPAGAAACWDLNPHPPYIPGGHGDILS